MKTILIFLFALSVPVTAFCSDWKLCHMSNNQTMLFDSDAISWQTKSIFRVWTITIKDDGLKDAYAKNKPEIDKKLLELSSENYIPPFFNAFKMQGMDKPSLLWQKYPEMMTNIVAGEISANYSSGMFGKTFYEIGCVTKEAKPLETITKDGKVYNSSKYDESIFYTPNSPLGDLAKIICPAN